ncbi:MAG: RsmB/NOP family class I SAM-dependent RNA methyltransferase [Chthoniobacterales bacterium]
MAHSLSARSVAVAALAEWRRERRFADSILQGLLAKTSLRAADRGWAMELFYGVMRHLTLLDFWIGLLRNGGLDDDARDLLRIGLYQIFVLRTPSHAAVFETVATAPRRKRPVVNAVLRNSLRRAAELEAAAAGASISTRFSHPEFLIGRWSKEFGADAAMALCAWNNKPAPIYARVQTLVTTCEEFLALHPASRAVPGWPGFVALPGIPLEALAAGECYVQDPSTSVACTLLDPQPGESVLDACAAPGGKTSLLAELMGNRGRLVACDRDAARVETLRQNLQRLGAEIARPAQHDWRDGPLPGPEAEMFDRILIDAPCTNTGVMRRRVDLRWRLRPEDFRILPDEQLQIVRGVLPHLKPGGTLVYSTCSIEPEENERLVERALEAFPFLRLEEQKCVLPFRDAVDGAYAARLLRER